MLCLVLFIFSSLRVHLYLFKCTLFQLLCLTNINLYGTSLFQDDDEDVRDVINGMLVSAQASSTTNTAGSAAETTPVLTIPAGFPTTEVKQNCDFCVAY